MLGAVLPAPSFEREPMKYLTIVYSLPAGFDVGTLTQHEFACAFAWSHKMDECNDLKAINNRQVFHWFPLKTRHLYNY